MHEGCRYFKYPATNSAWWKDKLLNNKIRDSRKINELEKLGWKVLVVWECEIKINLFSTMKYFIKLTLIILKEVSLSIMVKAYSNKFQTVLYYIIWENENNKVISNLF